MKNELVEDFDNPPAHFLMSNAAAIEPVEENHNAKYMVTGFALVLMVIVAVLGKIFLGTRDREQFSLLRRKRSL